MDNQDLKARRIRKLERQQIELYEAADSALWHGNRWDVRKIEEQLAEVEHALALQERV